MPAKVRARKLSAAAAKAQQEAMQDDTEPYDPNEVARESSLPPLAAAAAAAEDSDDEPFVSAAVPASAPPPLMSSSSQQAIFPVTPAMAQPVSKPAPKPAAQLAKVAPVVSASVPDSHFPVTAAMIQPVVALPLQGSHPPARAAAPPAQPAQAPAVAAQPSVGLPVSQPVGAAHHQQIADLLAQNAELRKRSLPHDLDPASCAALMQAARDMVAAQHAKAVEFASQQHA